MTTNVDQRALAIVHTTTKLILAAEKFTVTKSSCRILHEYLYMYVYKKGTVFRKKLPPLQILGDEISTLRIVGFGKILYWTYTCKYTCTKIRLFLGIPIHLNAKYLYIVSEILATSALFNFNESGGPAHKTLSSCYWGPL